MFFIDKAKTLIQRLDRFEREADNLGWLVQETEEHLTRFDNKALLRRLLALKYRTAVLNKSYPDPRALKLLVQAAKDWKDSQSYLSHKELDNAEIERLSETSRYAEFTGLALQDASLKQELLAWILRDGNDPDPFILFPALTEKLIETHLSERIGRHGGKGLKMKNGQLTLLMQGQDVSLHDGSLPIIFGEKLTLTLDEVFEIFKNKNIEAGSLEFMQQGIILWDPLGWIDEIDTKQANWWAHLPLFETLTRQEAVARYHQDIPEGSWVAAAASTRGTLSLDFNQTHAFLEVAIPTPEGLYNIYYFGKYAKKFPKNAFETLKMFCKISYATVAYPDENVFYSFREHALYPFILVPEEGLALMSHIMEDVVIARANNLVYQIESENCAKWVHFTLLHTLGEERVPDLFWMPLLNTTPNGFLAWVFRMLKKLPAVFQLPLLALLHVPLGAFQQTLVEEKGILVAQSLMRHAFFKHGHVFLPALLNHKIYEAEQLVVLALERMAWGTQGTTVEKFIFFGMIRAYYMTCQILNIPYQNSELISSPGG